MGWLYGWNTRKELTDHLLRSNGVFTIKHCFAGNNLWAVQEYTIREGERAGEKVRFIALYLLRGKNNSRDGWGYKDLDESAGPCYYNCPIKYLDIVPDPGGYATEWRAKVREHHERARRRLAVGQKIKLYGKEYEVTKDLGRSGYRIGNLDVEYRLPTRMIKDVEILV